MTQEELRQKLLFACMQNPAMATIDENKDGCMCNRKAICAALDTADEIIENWKEEFDIE